MATKYIGVFVFLILVWRTFPNQNSHLKVDPKVKPNQLSYRELTFPFLEPELNSRIKEFSRRSRFQSPISNERMHKVNNDVSNLPMSVAVGPGSTFYGRLAHIQFKHRVKRAQDDRIPYALRSIADLLPNTNWVIADQEDSNLLLETGSDLEPEIGTSLASNLDLDSSSGLDTEPEMSVVSNLDLKTDSDSEPEIDLSLTSNLDLETSSFLDNESEMSLVSNLDSKTASDSDSEAKLETGLFSDAEMETSSVSNLDNFLISSSIPNLTISSLSNFNFEANLVPQIKLETNSISNLDSELQSITSSDLNQDSGFENSSLSILDSSTISGSAETISAAELEPVKSLTPRHNLITSFSSVQDINDLETKARASLGAYLDSNSINTNLKDEPNSSKPSNLAGISDAVWKTNLDSDPNKRRVELNKPGYSFFPRQDWRKFDVQFPSHNQDKSRIVSGSNRLKRELADPYFSFFPRTNWRKFELEFQAEKEMQKQRRVKRAQAWARLHESGFSFFPRREWFQSDNNKVPTISVEPEPTLVLRSVFERAQASSEMQVKIGIENQTAFEDKKITEETVSQILTQVDCTTTELKNNPICSNAQNVNKSANSSDEQFFLYCTTSESERKADPRCRLQEEAPEVHVLDQNLIQDPELVADSELNWNCTQVEETVRDLDPRCQGSPEFLTLEDSVQSQENDSELSCNNTTGLETLDPNCSSSSQYISNQLKNSDSSREADSGTIFKSEIKKDALVENSTLDHNEGQDCNQSLDPQCTNSFKLDRIAEDLRSSRTNCLIDNQDVVNQDPDSELSLESETILAIPDSYNQISAQVQLENSAKNTTEENSTVDTSQVKPSYFAAKSKFMTSRGSSIFETNSLANSAKSEVSTSSEVLTNLNTQFQSSPNHFVSPDQRVNPQQIFSFIRYPNQIYPVPAQPYFQPQLYYRPATFVKTHHMPYGNTGLGNPFSSLQQQQQQHYLTPRFIEQAILKPIIQLLNTKPNQQPITFVPGYPFYFGNHVPKPAPLLPNKLVPSVTIFRPSDPNTF